MGPTNARLTCTGAFRQTCRRPPSAAVGVLIARLPVCPLSRLLNCGSSPQCAPLRCAVRTTVLALAHVRHAVPSTL